MFLTEDGLKWETLYAERSLGTVQLTLEQHGFELHRSTYMQSFPVVTTGLHDSSCLSLWMQNHGCGGTVSAEGRL